MIRKKAKAVIIKELSTFQKEFRKKLSIFITSSLGFVTALLWRDLFKDFFEFFQFKYKILTVVVVTFISVIAIVIISRVLRVE